MKDKKNILILVLFISSVVLGVLFYNSIGSSDKDYEQEYKDAMNKIELLEKAFERMRDSLIKIEIKNDKQMDSLIKENNKLKKELDEIPIPNTDPITDDAVLLDSILHYARK